jgi:hypothetical protein
MPNQSHSSRFEHTNSIVWAVQIIKLPITYFSPLPCYLVPLRPKYSPQYPILKHPQPTFLPQCERPNFLVICVFLVFQEPSKTQRHWAQALVALLYVQCFCLPNIIKTVYIQ